MCNGSARFVQGGQLRLSKGDTLPLNLGDFTLKIRLILILALLLRVA